MSGLTGVLAITDEGWFENLRGQPVREEVNFWKPSARRGINADAFTPLLFKLEAPHNAEGEPGHRSGTPTAASATS